MRRRRFRNALLLALLSTLAAATHAVNVDTVSFPDFCGVGDYPAVARGSWLERGWGVRVVIPAGNNNKQLDRFEEGPLIEQLVGLKTAKWVMLNLTAPSFGGLFSSPDALLARQVSPRMVPERDLLERYIDALKASGYRIIVYVASQGPSLEFLKPQRVARMKEKRPKFYQNLHSIEQAWKRHLVETGMTSQQAFAEVIQRYSVRLGNKIDGWWFDHGVHADPDLLIPAAKAGNSQALVTWNGRPRVVKLEQRGSPIWLLKRSHAGSDYVDGHVSPTRKDGRGENPWWEGNEILVRQVEECADISGALEHLFVPLQSTWRAGEEVFPADTAAEWTRRVIAGGGGITWAAALRHPEYRFAEIDPRVYEIVLDIDAQLRRTGYAQR